ncbi:MAG: FeoA family protein [Kiritimatiellae bacterium]|nr:FeoA family protein [Kiritimatiellia bacterium]MDY0149209.1 FeoA family protein [Kiritimatiellia bacterium]
MHDVVRRPLSCVLPGSTVRLRGIRAGRELATRLSAMGFVPGEMLHVQCNARSGPLVVAVKGCRMILGRGMADKIAVE